jgi:hypothetical protein
MMTSLGGGYTLTEADLSGCARRANRIMKTIK